MSFTAITLCVASQRVFIVVSVYFVNRLSPETFGQTLVRVIQMGMSWTENLRLEGGKKYCENIGEIGHWDLSDTNLTS
jgi:hypothetical protein